MKFENAKNEIVELKDLSNASLLLQYNVTYHIAITSQTEKNWNDFEEVREEILKRMGE